MAIKILAHGILKLDKQWETKKYKELTTHWQNSSFIQVPPKRVNPSINFKQ